jgi:peptidoglycan/xylan/chitin deacetylase (PgdA/CDA1 family)
LESIKDQDYAGTFEIIVVDNGSKDGTARIARECGARVVSCTAKGVIPAREYGARVATGDIIVQADADTLYPNDWLTRLTRHIEKHPEAVAVGGPFVYRDPPRWAWLEYIFRNLLNIISLFVYGKPCFTSGANFAFRRETFILIGGYDPDAISPDQLGMAIRLAKMGRIRFDTSIKVFTSSRRVQKPFAVVLSEGVVFASRAIARGINAGVRELAALGQRRLALRTFARVLPVIALVGFMSYGYFVPGSQVFGEVYYQNKALGNTIALTFDDGPNEPYTTQILDILAEYNVKATFFAIGMNVESYPDVARRIVAEGHVIGNHSYTHDANHALDPEGWRDIMTAQESISGVLGVRPHLYRPPHGKKSPWEMSYMHQLNMATVTWAISGYETLAKSPEELADQITNRERDGRVVLLHDGYATIHNTTQSDKSLVVKALPIIIERLKKDGYTFVTVPEMFGIPAYN